MIIKDLQIDVENERVTPDLWSPRSGVVTLYDMLRLYANCFVKTLWDLHYMEAKWSPNSAIIPAPQQVSAAAAILQIECLTFGLNETAKKCIRIREQFGGSQPVTYAQAVAA